jgi:hypothetical protein
MTILAKDLVANDLVNIIFRNGFGVAMVRRGVADVIRYRNNGKSYMTQIVLRISSVNMADHQLAGALGDLAIAGDQNFRVSYDQNILKTATNEINVGFAYIYKCYKLEPYPGHIVVTSGTPAYGVNFQEAMWNKVPVVF